MFSFLIGTVKFTHNHAKDFLMNQVTVQLSQATFFGIAVRTSNKNGMDPTTAKIPVCIQ
jgi:hypothetical protein